MKVAMRRIQIVGLKRELPTIMSTLQQLGCVQIEDVASHEDVAARPMQPAKNQAQRQEQLGQLLSRIDGLLNVLATAAPPIRHQECMGPRRKRPSDRSPQRV